MKTFQIQFFVLLICAVFVAVGLVFLLTPQPKAELIGGLQPGAVAPRIAAEGWLNGEGPAEGSLTGKVVVVEAWMLG